MLFLTVMRFPKEKEIEKQNIYDARIIETNVIVGIAICGLVAVTGLKKEMFMIYSLCFTLHLIVNTYVRLKYYFNLKNIDNIIISIVKGLVFVFIPSLIINKIKFNEFLNPILFAIMFMAMVMSSLLIYEKKKNVQTEEITIDNGVMHTKIVFYLIMMVSGVQLLLMR